MTAAAHEDALSVTFGALADSTRRGILARLAEGDATVNELAALFPAISLQAVSKHLKVLERAGLVTRGRSAQQRPSHLRTAPLADVGAWLEHYRHVYEGSLDRLGEHLAQSSSHQATPTATHQAPAAPVVQQLIPAWSRPLRIDRGFVPVAVSCPSASFCMAVGSIDGNVSNGFAATFNGTSWSSPRVVDRGLAAPTSVSCGTNSSCLALLPNGRDVRYGATGWASVQMLADKSLDAVSCVSTTFCAAVANDASGDGMIFSQGGWSPVLAVSSSPAYAGSCGSSSFCGEVGASGATNIWNGQAWGSGPSISGDTNAARSVSCTSSFCEAVDHAGSAFRLSPGVSFVAPVIVSDESLNGVSCAASTFCLTVGDHGVASYHNGKSWSKPTTVDPGRSLRSVSCVSTQFWVAVDKSGRSLIAR